VQRTPVTWPSTYLAMRSSRRRCAGTRTRRISSPSPFASVARSGTAGRRSPTRRHPSSRTSCGTDGGGSTKFGEYDRHEHRGRASSRCATIGATSPCRVRGAVGFCVACCGGSCAGGSRVRARIRRASTRSRAGRVAAAFEVPRSYGLKRRPLHGGGRVAHPRSGHAETCGRGSDHVSRHAEPARRIRVTAVPVALKVLDRLGPDAAHPLLRCAS
jgi:hypothetical protein